MKSNEDGLFVKRLRSLFPAIEIKIDHVRIVRSSLICFNSFFLFRVEYLLDMTRYPMDY